MKFPDTNVLVNSVNAYSPVRTQAAAWLEDAFNAPAGIGFSWLALVGFVRVSTRQGILQNPLSVGDALGLVDAWLSHPNAQTLHPTARHGDILARLLLSVGTAGNLSSDAHLAALCIEHNATLGTFDKDFKRFANVKIDLLTATFS